MLRNKLAWGSRHRFELAAACVFLAALLARLWGIGDKPFWLDEVTTLDRIAQPTGDIIRDSLGHHHMPLYFILVSWLEPWQAHEGWLRLPSAVLGAGSCLAVFAVAWQAAGIRAGLAAGLLMAFSPLQVQYGQEARSYTLLLMLIALAMWGLLRLARDPQAAARAFWQRGARRGDWALYLLGTWGALQVLSVALFWPAAALVGVASLARLGGRGVWRNWAIGHALIALTTLPWFLAMYQATEGDLARGVEWVPSLSFGRIWAMISALYLQRVSSLITFHLFRAALPGFGLLTLAAAVTGALALRTRRAEQAILLSGWLVLPALLLLISLAFPLWMPRYALWSTMAFFALAGIGIAHLPRRASPAVFSILVAMSLVNLAPYYAAETKPRWDQAARTLAAEWREGDAILIDEGASELMGHFLGRDRMALPPETWITTLEEAWAWQTTGSRVWAVLGTVGQRDVIDRAAFLERLAPLGPVTWRRDEGRDITLLRFDPPAEFANAEDTAEP